MASLAHAAERPRRRERKERPAPVHPAASSSTAPGLVVASRFANDLPLPPVPKLLRALPSCRRFSKYSATSMELDDRPWVLPEKDPEARIELVNTSVFGSLPEVGSMQPPLQKEDQKICSDYDLSWKAIDADKKRKRLSEDTEAFHREAFGLQLPQLLTNDVFTERQRYTTGTDSTEKKLQRNPPPRLTDEDLTKQVERTFEAAVEEPVHPTDPTLKAKRVLPLVPDAMVWANKYKQVVFDELPQDQPKRQDVLFMSVPNPRITCFGYFSSPSDDGHGGNTYRLAQNYVWENRGGLARQNSIGEGEGLLLSVPEDDQQGEIRFVPVPPWTRLKKQKAFKLDLQLPTQILNVEYREPSVQEAEEEHARMGVVLRDEAVTETTSDTGMLFGLAAAHQTGGQAGTQRSPRSPQVGAAS